MWFLNSFTIGIAAGLVGTLFYKKSKKMYEYKTNDYLPRDDEIVILGEGVDVDDADFEAWLEENVDDSQKRTQIVRCISKNLDSNGALVLKTKDIANAYDVTPRYVQKIFKELYRVSYFEDEQLNHRHVVAERYRGWEI